MEGEQAKAEATAEPVSLDAILGPPPAKRRHRMTPRKLSKYQRQRNRKTFESSLFKWREFEHRIFDEDTGGQIAGGIDFFGCKLISTLDESDPAMHEGKKLYKVRWIPSTLTFIFYPHDDPKSARVFVCDLSKLTRVDK